MKMIKGLVIINTLLIIILMGAHFIFNLWFSNNQFFKYFAIFTALIHHATLAIILQTIWKDKLLEKKQKIDKTFMVLFLGIVGMWLWLVNSKKK